MLFHRFALALIASLTLPVLGLSIEIDVKTTPDGHEVWTVLDEAVPLTSVSFRFQGGAQLDRDGKRGETNLMVATLEEGAGELDAIAFAEAREELAAVMRFRAFDDAISVSAQFTSDVTTPAMELLALAITQPSFDDAAVERVRGQVLAGLRVSAEDPEDKADNTLWATMFPDDPYGTDQSGTIESVSALTAADLRTAHDRVLSRQDVYISVVGDFDWAEIGPQIDAVLAPLSASHATMPAPVEPEFPTTPVIVEHDAPQTIIRFMQPGILREDPDFLKAFVLNQIISGSFEGRLMQALREERGLTYGVGASWVPQERAGVYLGALSVPNERAGEAVEVIKGIWADMAANGVSQEELDRAVTFLTGEYPLRFDGNARIASILTGMQASRLDVHYPNTRNAQVRAITLAEINAVIERLISPEQLSFVLVGRPEGL